VIFSLPLDYQKRKGDERVRGMREAGVCVRANERRKERSPGIDVNDDDGGGKEEGGVPDRREREREAKRNQYNTLKRERGSFVDDGLGRELSETLCRDKGENEREKRRKKSRLLQSTIHDFYGPIVRESTGEEEE
jgi:hypothetical protein